jgi:enterochelin esterase-like enzyme
MPSHSNSWWVNGNRESAEKVFFKELIPAVEKEYRTIKDRTGRAIGGVSAGGYGSVLYILKYPEMFAAGAALSPTIYTPLPPKNAQARSSYPFTDANEKFEEETWKRLNYPSFIGGYFKKNIKVPMFFVCGDHDKFNIVYHVAALLNTLRNYQQDLIEFRVVDGDHDWTVWSNTIGEAMIYMLQYVSKPTGEN